jgi:hypothetical protein
MIRVFVEVTEGVAPLRVEVRAKSIGQAVATIEELHPGSAVEVVFPIDPEKYFVDEPRETGTQQDLSRTLVHDPVGRA